jgi:phage-related protein
MEINERFKVVLSKEADDFLGALLPKIRGKIIYNIRKASCVIDPELFKKLDDTDIWEFRTLYNGKQYRLLAFWDKTKDINTLVIATHGFIKKTRKTPLKEIVKAKETMKTYFEQKK